MGRRVGLILGGLLSFSLLGLPAAELLFEPAPRLLGTFHVVVRGVPEEKGEVVLFNVASGERLVLSLTKVDGVLKSELVQVLRPCDSPQTKAHTLRVREAGELLVAVTELACGLSAVAKVEPRAGKPELFLEAKDGEQWKPVKALEAGEYRVRVVYPPADRTCEPDPLPHGLRVRAGPKEITLELKEDAPTSGSFTWRFSTAFELDRETHELMFVLKSDKESLRVPAVCTTVIFFALDQRLEARIQLLSVEVKPATVLLVPVGCKAELRVEKPEKPEEVWWWVPGRGWFAGPSFEIFVDEPTLPRVPKYPEALLIEVFVRKGAAWGISQAALSLIPRPKLLFVDPGTGEEIVGAWPVDRELKLRVTDLLGFPGEVIRVRMGKLGPHPLERPVELRKVKEGVYESEILSPKLWHAKAGEYLWAQLHYPEPIECVISVLLPLR